MVDAVFQGGAETVRSAFVGFKDCAFDEFCLEQRCVGIGDDLVVVALDDEGGDVEFFEVFVLIGFGECLDALVNIGQASHHALLPK